MIEIPIIFFLLTPLGFFCLGALVVLKIYGKWKIKCICLEHTLARLQKREPRKPEDIHDPVEDII